MTGFSKLTPREQLLLLIGVPVLLALALWFYVLTPLAAQRAAQSDRIAHYMAVIEIAQREAPGAPEAAPHVPQNTAPLGPRVTQSAESAGIALARLDPDGARLRVTVAKAGFDEITRWIAALEAKDGVRALSIEMTRLTEPGQVSLRLTLEDAG